MRPETHSINNVLSKNNTSFFIPPFQRSYAWGTKEIDRFYQDLSRIINSELNENERDKQEHFFGTIVIKPEGTGFSEKSIIVDGQQRLTTTLLFLIALRDSTDDEKIKRRIQNSYLCNADSDFQDKIKLKQVSKDWDSYRALINGNIDEANGQIKRAYLRFSHLIASKSYSFENYITALGRLNVAVIFLDERPFKGEDPQLIFETLNSLGKPLTLSDLIRNYVLFKMGSENQTEIYEKIWYPKIEEIFGDDTSKFFRDFLQYKKSSQIKVISDNNTKEIYQIFKEFVENKDIYNSPQDFVNDVVQYVSPYKWIISSENNDIISKDSKKDKIIKELLRNIFHDITSDSFKSFVLGLLFYYQQKKISEDDLVENLEIIRTYLIRRRIIGLTSAENKTIPTYCNKIEEISKHKISLWEILTGMYYYLRLPNDEEIRDKLVNVNFYVELKKYCKFILGKIEENASKVSVDFRDKAITIEHIMPQKITGKWEDELGPDYNSIHEQYVHNIGNLILTEFNGEMGNKSFEEKKSRLNDSNLIYRKDILKEDRWNEDSILRHQEKMIKAFLNTFPLKIEYKHTQNWVSADVTGEDKYRELDPLNFDGSDVTGSKPFKLIIGDNEVKTGSWQSVYLQFLKYIIDSGEYDVQILMRNQEKILGRPDAIISYAKVKNLNSDDKKKYKTIDGKYLDEHEEMDDKTLFYHINISATSCVNRIANIMENYMIDEGFVKIFCE